MGTTSSCDDGGMAKVAERIRESITVGSRGPYIGRLWVERNDGLLDWWVDLEFFGEPPDMNLREQTVTISRNGDIYTGAGIVGSLTIDPDGRGTARVVGASRLVGPGLSDD
jgi:hypothetical protein